jgi:AhpC/TSA family
VWQKLYEDLKDRNFTIVAVAMDEPRAARPFIEAAAPSYVSLIDRDHHVAALYGMVNVPEAVWIDEGGRIMRPAENAGWADGFRRRNRTTGEMPSDAAELMVRSKQVYIDAVRDWVVNGAASRHVLGPDAARQQLRVANDDIALAQAHFRLGRHLESLDRKADAARHFEEARRLHPDSWNIWRQTFGRNELGFASGPEFWARVDALGSRKYYPPANIEGMPE